MSVEALVAYIGVIPLIIKEVLKSGVCSENNHTDDDWPDHPCFTKNQVKS